LPSVYLNVAVTLRPIGCPICFADVWRLSAGEVSPTLQGWLNLDAIKMRHDERDIQSYRIHVCPSRRGVAG
jgi:hypothetical protein